ncbi:MAG TPA: FHA domain-containing protein [Bacteriovoracaceae bacterium]|nr:FHA domain-containing protein [Bacteriovoracaceae bacterium]
MAKNVLVLRNFDQPKEAGVYFKLICLTGPNKGETYYLIGNRLVVGRSEKADIRINDNKTSREHAEFTKVGQDWIVTDLGSQNGVVVNDKKAVQHKIKIGDRIIIGQTVLKFAKEDVAAKPKLVKGGKVEEDEEQSTSASKKTMVPVLILAVVFMAMFLLDDETPQNEPPKKVPAYQDATNEYVQALQKRQANEDKQVKERLNTIYQRGLREFRERNYFRAIHEFNLALIIAPGDAQAEYYLRKTKEHLDQSIEDYIVKAQRDEESLKYQSAIVSYCSIIRLLYTVPDDVRYKNAEKQIKDLELKLGLEPGETHCLKKQRTP